MWVLVCFWRSPEVLKDLQQFSSWHLYGFSPVCVREWLFSPYPEINHSYQVISIQSRYKIHSQLSISESIYHQNVPQQLLHYHHGFQSRHSRNKLRKKLPISSTATCCKFLSTAGIITDIWFVSSVWAFMYLQIHRQNCSCVAVTDKQVASDRNVSWNGHSSFPCWPWDGGQWCKVFHNPHIHSGKTSRLHLRPLLACCLDLVIQSERHTKTDPNIKARWEIKGNGTEII